MKYFWAVLFVLSINGCDHKVSRSKPYTERLHRPTDTKVLSKMEKSYSTRAEGVYGLLWPVQMELTDPSLLANVMTRARGLQATRKSYTIENERIKKLNTELKCDCATAGICEENEDPASFPPDTVERCTSLEEQKFENDQKLSQLLEQQTSLKEAVLEAGGDWLENDPIDLRLDFSAMKFDVSAFRFINLNKEMTSLEASQNDRAGPYDKKADRVYARPDSIYWAAGQNISRGSLEWELDGLELPGALQFQGKMTVKIDGIERKGQLGFQLPEK